MLDQKIAGAQLQTNQNSNETVENKFCLVLHALYNNAPPPNSLSLYFDAHRADNKVV